MPVVSQSMARPIVPVGAMTTAWLFRTPLTRACSSVVSHAWRLAATSSAGTPSASEISRLAARCMSSTRSVCSAFASYPSNAPSRAAVRALAPYAVPAINEVISAAQARPSSES